MKKLGKMEMPKKRREHMDEMDMSELGLEEGSPEEERAESPEQEHEEMAAGEADASDAEAAPEEHSGERPADLDTVSDDELMAEIKKRGLMSELAAEGEGEVQSEPDQEMYS